MKTQITTDITIIGAGLTGLTMAYYLKKFGVSVCLVEKEESPGGVIHSYNENGFIFESGPNTGVIGNIELIELFDDLATLCELETANQASKKRLIWKNKRWRALPSGPISALFTPLFSIKDKLNILFEPFRKRGKYADETIAELVLRRLGKSYLNYAVDPFISGIYAGDPSRLVTRFALPKLYMLEQQYGSFIKGGIKKAKEPKTEKEKKVTREVFSIKGGLSNLTNALYSSIGKETVILNALDVKISQNKNKFITSYSDKQKNEFEIKSSKVITTINATSLPHLLSFISEHKLAPISKLNYAGVVQVAVGYNHWNGMPLDSFGGLVPSIERQNILGMLFPSSIFADRCPKGGALISVFMGGMRRPEMIEKTDKEIEEIAMQQIQFMLKPNNSTPTLIKIYRYKQGIPQYDASSDARLNAITTLEKEYPGLILAGNIRDGIGMADRVKQAINISFFNK